MNNLQIFNNPEFGNIRTVTIDGEPWFVGKDIAEALGYSNSRKALIDHVDDEDKGVTNRYTPGGKQNLIIINESGLYSLILSSKLPSAKKFKRWVTSEVLPAIRKTGRYTVEEVPQRALTKDDYIKAASMVSSCKNERLPYVLGFLEQAGFEIPVVEKTQQETEEDDLVKLLNEYSLSELVDKLGICRTSIYYYRIGKSRPQEERLNYILNRLL